MGRLMIKYFLYYSGWNSSLKTYLKKINRK